MGITIFKMFIWGGILSLDIWSEITFYGYADASTYNLSSNFHLIFASLVYLQSTVAQLLEH